MKRLIWVNTYFNYVTVTNLLTHVKRGWNIKPKAKETTKLKIGSLISAFLTALHLAYNSAIMKFSWAQSCIKMWFSKNFRDGVSTWNARKPSHLDTAVCPRKCNWILSLQELQDLNLCYNSVFFCLFSGCKLTQLHQTEADPWVCRVWSMHDIRASFIWLLCLSCFHRAAHEYIYMIATLLLWK